MPLFYTIPHALESLASVEAIKGSFELPELSLGPDTYVFDKALTYDLILTNTGEAYLLTGTVSGTATTACARCLEDFSLELSAEAIAYFIEPKSEDEPLPEGLDEDEIEFILENRKIDLEPVLRAALMYELPLVPLHAQDCKGLCPECGENLNEKSCSCVRAEDPDFSKNPFSVLQALKLND